MKPLFYCPYTDKPCFARTVNKKCKLLEEKPKKGCHFQKPYKEYTKGKYYPYKY